MKKYFLIGTMVFLMLFNTAIPVFAEEKGDDSTTDIPKLAEDANSAILMERDTGKMLFDKNANEKLPPASMTKIMTLLLIMEAIDKGNLKMDEMVRVSERASSMGGSQIFLEEGEEMSVEDLLKGIAMASGNDASVALAERIAGSEEAFVKRMNEKVKDLNLKNTHFQNTTGLPAKDHYSTASDMAVIAKALLKYESITKFTSVYEDYLRKGKDNEFWLVNTNKLVKFYPGVDGLKTGFTNEAKYCLTATAKKNDMRVIAVVMGAKSPKKRNEAVSQMLDYAFNHFETKQLFKKDQVITSLQLLKAENKHVNIVASESISTIHKKGADTEDIKTAVELDKDIASPMKKGDSVGMLYVKNGEKILSETPLTINQDIKTASYFTFLKRSLQKMAKYN